MLANAGVASICAYDAGVVDEMEGVDVVCRTRLTSFRASSDHRSTLRTYMVCSMSLGRSVLPQAGSVRLHEHLLAVNLLSGSSISDHKSNAWWRRDRPSVLNSVSITSLRGTFEGKSQPCLQSHTCALVAAVA